MGAADNKPSCLDLAGGIAGFRVPRGITVTTPDELEGALRAMLAGGGRVIVKSMHGISGDGSIVVAPGDPDAFWATTSHDHFLQIFPVVVQQYLEHAEPLHRPVLRA